MKSYDFDITIIGGGCIGSSILHELTRRGFCNIGLIDCGRNSMSATVSSGGMIRVFHENPTHIELALGNYSLLKKYQASGVLKQRMMFNGSLYFFNKHRYIEFQKNLEIMDGANYPFEVFTTACGRKHFPQFLWNDNEWAIYEPQGTQLTPSLFTENLLTSSINAGAMILDDLSVLRFSHHRDYYRISGNEATITTKILILAGGARLLPRLKDLGLNLPLESKMITTYIAIKSKNCIPTHYSSIPPDNSNKNIQKTNADTHLNKKRNGMEKTSLNNEYLNIVEPQTTWFQPNYFDRETLNFACLGQASYVTLSSPEEQRLIDRPWERSYEEKSELDCYAPNRIGYAGQISGLPHLHLATGWGGTGFKFALEIGNHIATAIDLGKPERRQSYALL